MKAVTVFYSISLFISLFLMGACGVKGKPLPPVTPPVLGRGEPSLSKATEGVKLKKKSTNTKGEPDWDDDDDFAEESNP